MDTSGPKERAARLTRNLKMARSAHAYVRGSTVKFYDWLESSSRKIPEGPPVCRVEYPPGLGLVALPTGAAGPGSVDVPGRPIWMGDGVVLKDGALGDLPPWFVGWFLAEAPRS
jgi:Uncharacterized protein conserved in bacteria (DUF2252)